MKKQCPLCNKYHEIIDCQDDFDTILYKCDKTPCKIHESVFESASVIDKERRLNAIYNYVYEHPYADQRNTYWRFFYEETNDAPHKFYNINVFHLMNNYPYDIEKRTNSILLALHKLYPTMSDSFKIQELYENKEILNLLNHNVDFDSIEAEIKNIGDEILIDSHASAISRARVYLYIT